MVLVTLPYHRASLTPVVVNLSSSFVYEWSLPHTQKKWLLGFLKLKTTEAPETLYSLVFSVFSSFQLLQPPETQYQPVFRQKCSISISPLFLGMVSPPKPLVLKCFWFWKPAKNKKQNENRWPNSLPIAKETKEGKREEDEKERQ